MTASVLAAPEIFEPVVPIEKETFPARLWELREAAGLSQTEVAEASDGAFQQPHYSMWEAGRSLPSVTKLEPLAKALRCKLLDLFKSPKPSSVEAFKQRQQSKAE